MDRLALITAFMNRKQVKITSLDDEVVYTGMIVSLKHYEGDGYSFLVTLEYLRDGKPLLYTFIQKCPNPRAEGEITWFPMLEVV